MSNKQRSLEISSNEFIEISNNGELSEKEPTHESTSLGEADYITLEKLEKIIIIEEPIEGQFARQVEGHHRTLRFINKEDQNLYEEIRKWVKKYPNKSIEDTISEFDPRIYYNSDALAKVAHNYPPSYLPDFIIRYKEDVEEEDVEKEDEKKAKKRKDMTDKRENFERCLLKAGLVLEHDKHNIDGKIYTHVKVIAPFKILCKQAEQIKLKMCLNDESLSKRLPIPKEYNNFESKSIFSKIRKQFTHTMNLEKVSLRFKQDRLGYFIGEKPVKEVFRNSMGEEFEKVRNKFAEATLNFFNTSKRNLLVHGMIIAANETIKKVSLHGSTVHVKRREETLAIQNLVHEGVYDKLYPVHDGSLKIKNHKEFDKNNARARLYELWVKGFPKWKQPLNEIREYFGEKVALYFAWLGFYTSWLSIASIAGVIVTIYGLIYGLIDVKSGRKFGGDAGISIIWDNAFTVPYALLMAVWTTLFLETWKRANASIQYDWDVIDYERNELTRPRFYGIHEWLKKLLKRGLKESKPFRFFISGIIVLFSIGIVIGVSIAVVIPFRGWFPGPEYIASAATALLNLLTINLLSMVYKRMINFLTNLECRKTYTEHEDSLILKAYLFEFINFYFGLIYIMLKSDCSCNSNVCDICDPKDRQYMRELTIQLAVILIGKQFLKRVFPWAWELILTLLKKTQLKFLKGHEELNECPKNHDGWAHKLIRWLSNENNEPQLMLLKKKYKKYSIKVPQWVNDDLRTSRDDVTSSTDGIRNDYEEIIIQFGFIALFGVAFPLAPLFAFINNVTEVKTDALKYIKIFQKPVGFQAQDIGMWEKILQIVSFIAVLTNAIILTFHSSWMENKFITYIGDENKNELLVAKFGFLLGFVHLAFIIKLVLAYTVPDLPRQVTFAIEREHHLSRLALKNQIPVLDEYWFEEDDNDDDDKKDGNNDDEGKEQVYKTFRFTSSGSLILPGDNASRKILDEELP